MASIPEISKYNASLASKSQQEDSAFLRKIGKFLRGAERDELSAAVIFQIERLISNIHRKYEKQKVIKELKELLDEIKVSAYDLGTRAQNNQLDKGFFREILSLGDMLIQVSGILKSIALPIILFSTEHADTIQKLLEEIQNHNWG